MILDVLLLDPHRVIFKGKARSVILPGEKGVFEILPYHKSIVSRLISGNLFIDEKNYKIKRGIVGVYNNEVKIIIEEI
ncbi:MAG: hypothetical protein NC826_05635 [Candidatus Omnitrophica bacterium]|nr:hypothetical protein [Candidatus Omnitrophota bacterium]